MRYTVKDLISKLNEYTGDLRVAIDITETDPDIPIPIHYLIENIEFKVDKFNDGSSKKPYYKLVITAK